MSRHSLFMGKTNERWQDIFGLEVISVDLIKIGKFIAELRKEHGWTQEQLGEKLGVTNKTVSRWETGTYLPPADILLAMSELYHYSEHQKIGSLLRTIFRNKAPLKAIHFACQSPRFCSQY